MFRGLHGLNFKVNVGVFQSIVEFVAKYNGGMTYRHKLTIEYRSAAVSALVCLSGVVEQSYSGPFLIIIVIPTAFRCQFKSHRHQCELSRLYYHYRYHVEATNKM